MERSKGTITTLLNAVRDGDNSSRDRLFELVYVELRAIARQRIALAQRAGRGWDATALVHDAFLRLASRGQLLAEDRRHFFFVFRRAMMDIISENARAELCQKRGGGRLQVPLLECTIDQSTLRADAETMRLALEELRNRDPAGADVAFLRYFAGCTLDETAEILGSTLSCVRDDWDYAKAWLKVRLTP